MVVGGSLVFTIWDSEDIPLLLSGGLLLHLHSGSCDNIYQFDTMLCPSVCHSTPLHLFPIDLQILQNPLLFVTRHLSFWLEPKTQLIEYAWMHVCAWTSTPLCKVFNDKTRGFGC